MSKPKTVLPDNWRPCEVNQAPNFSQQEINKSCLFFCDQLFYEAGLTEEQEHQISLFVGLWKNQPKMINPNYANRISHTWKPCI
jgi:ethanolamine utilization protein EutP (predicted NTPase)